MAERPQTGHSGAMDRDEEQLLARRAAAGDSEAEQLLVESQRPFAERVAMRRGRTAPDVERALDLLRQNVRRFDPERGYRFSSWSTWWIQLSLSRRRD